MSRLALRNSDKDKDKDGGKAKFKRPFPYPLPQFSNFSMDFPVSHEDGALSYQRRYQMTQQQRINRFRQQRNFRSLREPTFNYSGQSSTYERETEDEEHQSLMRPTTPTPPVGQRSGGSVSRRGWSPDIDRQSSASSPWRDSSSFAVSRELHGPPPPQVPVRTRQPLMRGGGGSSSSSRSRDEDIVMVENCVSAPQLEKRGRKFQTFTTE